MPELPEVETVRRGLEPTIGMLIESCDVRRRDVVRDIARWTTDLGSGISSKDRPKINVQSRRGGIDPRSLLIGSTITQIRRHGKQLAIIAHDPSQHPNPLHAIGIHLGMSGLVLLTAQSTDQPKNQPKISPAKHVHCVWTLRDEHGAVRRIAFKDPRRFGKVITYRSVESLESDWARLGPDGEHISAKALGAGCSGTTRSIKAALLDQHLIAGVGNIYADEALFDAQVHPKAHACELSADQIKALARSIRQILQRAINARGSTLRDYRDASDQKGSAQLFHKVYSRAGEACVRCGSGIESEQIAQRTTCWCPQCQALD